MTTNFSKLVGWNVEEYNKMSDESCLVCLTQKEKYLLGQMTRQIVWLTRWDNPSGEPLPDLEKIQGDLDYKMSDESCVDFCQSIIDCINDESSGVASAIMQAALSGGYDVNRDNGQSMNNVELGAGVNPTCDKDILFGQAVQLVNYMDQLNTDLFEILEVASNYYDFFCDVIGNATLVDESSVDAAIAWVQFIEESIAENYAAQVTVSYKEDLACEIHCAAQLNGCAITPTLLYDIFKGRLESSITIEGVIWDALAFLVDGDWSGSQIADFMFFSQLALRSMIGRYFDNVAYRDINTRLQMYSNDPDSDWTTICELCCDEVVDDFDFTTDDYLGIWSKRSSIANMNWVSSVGWTGENPGGVQLANAGYGAITKVSGTYSVTSGAVRARIFQYASSTGTLGALIGTLPFDGYEEIDEDILVVIDSESATWDAVLSSLHIEGCSN